jgi:hypothetical protein
MDVEDLGYPKKIPVYHSVSNKMLQDGADGFRPNFGICARTSLQRSGFSNADPVRLARKNCIRQQDLTSKGVKHYTS